MSLINKLGRDAIWLPEAATTDFNPSFIACASLPLGAPASTDHQQEEFRWCQISSVRHAVRHPPTRSTVLLLLVVS
jgi:hypothetical protein